MRLAAVVVLLVAAPALLLLAHHVPLLVARRAGRHRGVVAIGSAADRALPRLRRLVLDAEHVVTTGHLVVVDVVPLDDRHQRDLRWFAGALAHESSTQVARAIARLSGPGKTVGVRQGPTYELQGSVDRHPVRIGVNDIGQVDEAGTTVRVDVDLRPMGHITVADEVRRTAARCLEALQRDGVEPILASATLAKPDLARIAEEVGLGEYHAGAGAAAVAATMPPATTGTLRAVELPGDLVGELVLPPELDEDTIVRCASPAIDTVLDSLRLVRSVRRSRRAARMSAIVVAATSLAAAAADLLSVAVAAVVAAASVVLVTTVAGLVVLADTGSPAAE